MKAYLVEQLLVKLMNWSAERIDIERPLLQAMASYKLDEYQQFAPGMRFMESLVNWLNQFKTNSEREIAYSFIVNNLVFISNGQVCQLIDICYSTHIHPFLVRKTSKQLNEKSFNISTIINSDLYRENQRTSIFIGLSDGARMDYFRRSSRINNEQILLTYAVSDDKAAEMIKDLDKVYNGKKFTNIFLIDDFTASGRSFIRKPNDVYKGKLIKTLKVLFGEGTSTMLIDPDNFELHILFYIATTDSLNYINSEIDSWKIACNKEFLHTVEAVQILPDSFNKSVLNNPDLLALCKEYFDPSIVNDHFKEGNYTEPYLGFNEGALPLILNHNTPNNSLAILWLPDDKKYRGLFPRVDRHN